MIVISSDYSESGDEVEDINTLEYAKFIQKYFLLKVVKNA